MAERFVGPSGEGGLRSGRGVETLAAVEVPDADRPPILEIAPGFPVLRIDARAAARVRIAGS